MAQPGAFSWNSELPSGHNPYWIRDEALSGLNLHVGDAVSVDTRAEARDGDLVVADVELEDDSLRTARRYFKVNGDVRLEAHDASIEPIVVPEGQVIIMGVIVARVRFSEDNGTPSEEPLDR